jgi:hypothetical protein
MKRQLSRFVQILIPVMFFLIPGQSWGLQNDLLPFENLTQDVGRGFGDSWNRYTWSMDEFNGKVYVGTWNVQLDYKAIAEGLKNDFNNQQTVQGVITQLQTAISGISSGSGNILEGIRFITSKGAEIWRNDGGQQWTQVYQASKEDTGFRMMHNHDGYIYVGSANSTTGADVLRTKDGVNWEKCGWVPNAANNSVRTFTTYNGDLYLGTENNSGGELWKYDKNNNKWIQNAKFANDTSVAELIVYKDKSGASKLGVGTWDFSDSYNFYTGDGQNFVSKTPVFQGSTDLQNLGVMKLIEYKGDVYLGTVNYRDGFTLLRTQDPENPNGWKVISTNGLGDKSNAYTWSMAEFNGKLYMGTFNDGLYGGLYGPLPLDGRAQLLCSTDGLNWETLVNDGFGSPFTYGFRNLLVADDRLFVGTASNFLIPDLQYLYQLLEGFDGRDAIMSQLRQYFSNMGQGPFIGTQVYASAPVPEPATMLLLAAGLLGLAGYWRKKLS